MTHRISTPRLFLEPVTTADEEEWWVAVWSDPEVTRFLPPRRALPRDHVTRIVQKAMDEWAANQFGIWVVREQDSGVFVGHCGLVINQPPRVELIYALRRQSWGQGFATEIAEAMVSYAGFALGITELDALVFEDNVASARVLEKLGFSRVGPVHRLGHDLDLYSYPAARARDSDRSSIP